ERVSGADLSARECHPRPRDGGVRALVDPARGRFAAAGGADGAALRVVRYHVGVPMPIGALPIARADVVADAAPSRGGGDVSLPAGGQLTFGDSRSYRLMVDAAVSREDLRVQAVDGARPYVRLAGGALEAAPGAARRLELSGVWLADAPLVLGRAHDAAPGVVDWDEVVVRDATLDPGGTRADGDAIAPVSIVVRARVRRLGVERSVLGGLVIDRDAGGSLGELWVRDSIVDGRFAGGVAIDAGDAAADLARTTLLGGLVVGRLEASDVVVFGEARVVDTANGCFRFSAADGGSRLPRRFESWPAAVGSDARVEAGFFRSLRFGDPEYAQMSALAPLELREGAETGGERGAYARLGEAARLRGVALKLEELTPVGVRAAFLPGGPLHGA
ncbi:MAG: hypothetical protein KF901_33805, partial [Myxococcales bacterium]|nr:hypothetical protein [Myxococcales bacterium]